MSSSVAEIANPVEETEAYETLLGRVAKRTGKIAAEDLVRHVLAIVPAAEWPVRVEAMDALLRRIDASKEDKLRVESRPPEGRILGLWATRRPGSGARPYRTVVIGDRPDRDAVRLPRLPAELAGRLQARADRARTPPRAAPAACSRRSRSRSGASRRAARACWWDPIRPLTGLGDWLERVAWRGETEVVAARSARAAQALQWFRAAKDGAATLKNAYRRRPEAAAGDRRGPDQGHPGRRVGDSATTPRSAPCSVRERQRLRLIVDQALRPPRSARGSRA